MVAGPEPGDVRYARVPEDFLARLRLQRRAYAVPREEEFAVLNEEDVSMLVVKSVHCCGMKDLKGMNNEKWSAKGFVKKLLTTVVSYKKPCKGAYRFAGYAHYLLSGAYALNDEYEPYGALDKTTDGTGVCPKAYTQKEQHRRFKTLKNLIEREGLGTVTLAPEGKSPTYGHKHIILTAIWTPDNKGLIKYGRRIGVLPKKLPKTGWTATGIYGM